MTKAARLMNLRPVLLFVLIKIVILAQIRLSAVNKIQLGAKLAKICVKMLAILWKMSGIRLLKLRVSIER